MKIFVMDLKKAEQIPERICEELFPKRFAKSKLYLKKEDSLRCIAAGMLLERAGIKEENIRTGKWEKPYTDDIFFNISHSGEFAVLAADCKEVGIDIEKPERFSIDTAKMVFTPEEMSWMNENPAERFFKLWTMKESAIKLDGRGFFLPPESFCVLPAFYGEKITAGNKQCYGRFINFKGYALSVCSYEKICDVEIELN